MGKKDKNKKKGKGAEKTALKTDKKFAAKQKKLLEKLGESDIADVLATLEAEESRRKTVIEQVCPPPTPRANFSLVGHPDKEELVLFGGEFYNGQKVCLYNDLFFYNIPKKEWKQMRAPGGPTPRSGHQMVSVATDGGQLWLFGGEYASPSQLQYHHYKDLWVLRLKTRQWEKINAPNGPSPRSGHRMVVAKKRLVVFGGFYDNNQAYRYFNDIHMFSLESYEWLKIEVQPTVMPLPRSGCCMAPYRDGKVLVWGGYSKEKMKKDTDRGVTHTDMFELIPDRDNPNKFKWSAVKTNGYKPPPRSSIGFTTGANHKVYCFGGVMDVDEDEEDVKGQFGDDLLVFDMSTQTWRLLEINKKTVGSKKSSKETDDEASMQMDNELQSTATTTPAVTSDGIFTVTVAGPSGTKSSEDTRPKCPSLFGNRPKGAPSPRMNPGLCFCKGTLYLFGGLFEEDSKQFTYNDLYALNVHKLEQWEVLIPNNYDMAHEWVDSESSESDEEVTDDDPSDSDDDDDSEQTSSGMETD